MSVRLRRSPSISVPRRPDHHHEVTQPAARRASVPATAVVPLRLFLGGAFLYAGFDKLLDPGFFDAANPSSIQAQMLAFARVSPIAPLLRLAQPVAAEIGLVIALAEIAV